MMTAQRPSPDELLARVRDEEARARRGKLKIFFGYAAGVGKTYAMLEAARREKADGVDVVVGYVEPHGRRETEALLAGLEVLPARMVPYRGANLRELDLDAALSRHPRLILVDELAHTNAEGMRHAKRWQDVVELMDAGIDVYTTLNVQHIESLNDVIARITGVAVRETLPDSVLERADDIELIDLTPEELMERLRQGKVYVPEQAERALINFFQKAHLQALRELSLREAAHRLRREVEASRHEKGATAPWATNERLLVCVGPSPNTARLIRSTRRMAAAFDADWIAVAVNTRGDGRREAARREQVTAHMWLADRLGAETQTIVGEDVATAIIDYARARNVTKIVVGKTAEPWWKRMLFGAVVDRLLEQSGEIDVYVITGEGETPPPPHARTPQAAVAWGAYLATALVVALCGLVGWLSQRWQLAEANVVMVFLLGVVLVAFRYGRGPAVAASIASVLVFDLFFVPPRFYITVDDAQYVLTFAVMLAVGVVISTLTARLRDRLRASQEFERRTAALFQLTRQMSEIAGAEFLIGVAGRQLADIFDGEVVIYEKDAAGPVVLRYGDNTAIPKDERNAAVARWVADHGEVAGVGTDTLPAASALFVPLSGSGGPVGAVGVKARDSAVFADPEQRRFLQTCASMIALSLERDRSVLEAHESEVRVQQEQVRNSLLNSVSHDLRTPLAAIAGAGAALLTDTMSEEVRRELVQSIVDESRHLSRLVDNLLDVTRLEAGGLALNKQWHVLEEIIGSARNRLRGELSRHDVRVTIPDGLPLIHVDGLLLEQVFVNLLENAARYTPEGSRIEIIAEQKADAVVLQVRDNGPGLPKGAERRVFEKFFRGVPAGTPDQRRGVGLGLTICDGVMRAHGGTIEARNRPEGGAEFLLTLPCRESSPQVPLEE